MQQNYICPDETLAECTEVFSLGESHNLFMVYQQVHGKDINHHLHYHKLLPGPLTADHQHMCTVLILFQSSVSSSTLCW